MAGEEIVIRKNFAEAGAGVPPEIPGEGLRKILENLIENQTRINAGLGVPLTDLNTFVFEE